MTTEIIAEKISCRKMRSKAQAAKVDLIIVGDKGRNTFLSLLVGSVTEELLTMIWKYLYGL
jgi:nucleotide-binding universal stress UspA family protein